MITELLFFLIWILSTAGLFLVSKDSMYFYSQGLHLQQAVQFTTARILPITFTSLLSVLMYTSQHLSLHSGCHLFPLLVHFLCVALILSDSGV